MEKTTWGGRREGSGRKNMAENDKRVQIGITIEREARDKLRARAKAEKTTPGKIVERLLRASEK